MEDFTLASPAPSVVRCKPDGSLVCCQCLLVTLEVVETVTLDAPVLSVVRSELDGSLGRGQGLLVTVKVAEC